MKHILLLYLLLISCLLSAQTNLVVVEGKVTDVLHNPVPYATIQNITTQEGANADLTGRYIFKTMLPAILKVSYLGYKAAIRKLSEQTGKDTMHIDFVLQVDSTQLKQVEITATHEPELVQESGSLVDFDWSHGKLLLLYEHSHGDQILLFDSAMRKLTTLQLKYHIEKLQRNERFDIYFSHLDSLYFLYYNPAANSFESTGFSEALYNSFQPVKAYNAPYYYYRHTMQLNAGVNYTAYNPENKDEKAIYSYFDHKMLKENMDTYEAVFELENAILSKFGVPGNGNASALRMLQQHLRNNSSMLVDVYSQINVVNDSVYVFNFNNDTFNMYDKHNTMERKLPMLFDQKKFVINKKEILTDDDQKECYFKYEINGITYLEIIDLNTGQASKLQPLKFPFVEKLRIFNGFAYYTYSGGGGARILYGIFTGRK